MARWFRPDLAVSGPFGSRCLTSRAMLRFYTPLIEPGVRICRIRLSDERRHQAHTVAVRFATSPDGQAWAAVAQSFCELVGRSQSHDLCPHSKRVRSQAPFLDRRYPASSALRACPPPHSAPPDSHGLRVGGHTPPPIGLAVLRLVSVCMHAVANTPAGPLGAPVARFPSGSSLPRILGASAPALPFSRPA